jgi:hypothetical protein
MGCIYHAGKPKTETQQITDLAIRVEEVYASDHRPLSS